MFNKKMIITAIVSLVFAVMFSTGASAAEGTKQGKIPESLTNAYKKLVEMSKERNIYSPEGKLFVWYKDKGIYGIPKNKQNRLIPFENDSFLFFSTVYDKGYLITKEDADAFSDARVKNMSIFIFPLLCSVIAFIWVKKNGRVAWVCWTCSAITFVPTAFLANYISEFLFDSASVTLLTNALTL